jgi:hypothetical protein
MKMRCLSIGMMSCALLTGWPAPWRLAGPPPVEAASQEVITCIGFLASLTIKDSPQQFAVVYVHNFGASTADYTVRFSDFNNATLASQAGSTPAGQTDLFFFGKSDPAPPNSFPASTFLIARVISESKRLLVDAESVYEGDLGSAQHRRHVGCGPTPPSRFSGLLPPPRPAP